MQQSAFSYKCAIYLVLRLVLIFVLYFMLDLRDCEAYVYYCIIKLLFSVTVVEVKYEPTIITIYFSCRSVVSE